MIRDLRPDDWTEVAAIYRDGMRGGMATFETEVPPWDAWHVAHPIRVVAELDERVIGWAALRPRVDALGVPRRRGVERLHRAQPAAAAGSGAR